MLVAVAGVENESLDVDESLDDLPELFFVQINLLLHLLVLFLKFAHFF